MAEPRRTNRPDPVALAAGLGLLVLGGLLLLDGAGVSGLTLRALQVVVAASVGGTVLVRWALERGRERRERSPAPPSAVAPVAPAADPGAAAGEATLRGHDGLVLGTAAALAARLGLDPLLVRGAFVLLTLAGGAGIPLYLLASVVQPEIGFARRARGDTLAVLVLLGGALLAVRQLGLPFSDALAWPLLLVLVGMFVLVGDRREDAPPAAAGVVLVAAGAVAFLVATGALDAARDVGLAVAAVLVAVTVVLGPWLITQGRALAEERSARIRSQERAEVAAHLHDSVLQTLALVQRRSDDPAQVAALARRQERELRAWLAGQDGRRGRLKGALEAAAAAVEADHDVAVEVVVVGDAELGARGDALVAAAREAMANAARHGGGGTVDVFAEAGSDGRLTCFVRDRGAGFDLAEVPADRHGVRESIIARMERHGGRAAITSAPGGGTEVELELAP